MRLDELAAVLVTPCEEFRVRCCGDTMYERCSLPELSLSDETDVLDRFGACQVTEADCYYTGDHMALHVQLATFDGNWY